MGAAGDVAALELHLLDPEVRRSAHAVLAHLHPDFEEHGASGRLWTRADVHEALTDDGPVVVEDLEAVPVGTDAVLVTYRAARAGRTSLRSSLWVRHEGTWLMRFHQGTLVPAPAGAVEPVPALAHVALWAEDLDRVCAFYERLGATRGPLYRNAVTGFRSHFLTWPDGGARLEVMARPDVVRDGGAAPSDRGSCLGWAHVALSLGSESAVDAAAADLSASGVPLVDGPRRTGDGYYECVVLDPEGNRVELTA